MAKRYGTAIQGNNQARHAADGAEKMSLQIAHVKSELEICTAMTQAATDAVCEEIFRGTIPEFLKDVPMGRGYANIGPGGRPMPFDIETACYTKPVFAAIQDPNIPVVACQAAVQMLKTFICCEASPAYFIANDPGDTTIYIGGDDSSRDQARSRILPYWWSIPEVEKLFASARAEDRFDIATQEFYLPAQTYRIWGLNESTTARITLRRVIGSDLYLSKSSGLWLQAMARVTQYKATHNTKIIGESQGGEEGDDADKFFKTTDMGFLSVKCPLCGTGQEFDFHHVRSQDTKIVAPISEGSLNWDAWVAHHRPILLSDERRNCGFKRGDDTVIKRADGSYNEAEIQKQTHYECRHCGGLWHDTPATRKQLDQSSYYIPSNPNALAGYKGFSWPSWAGQRLAWGGEEVMLGHLRALKIKETRGDIEPYKQWWQKRAGRPWNPKLASEISIRRRDAYDVGMAKHDAWRICMIVDNQQDLMTQWVMVLGVKKNGNVKQLWRGSLHGLDDVRKKQMEYVSTEGKPLIKDQFVFLDGRYKGENICSYIVEHKYGHWATMDGERVWLAWNLVMGSSYEYFSHADEKDKSRKFVCGDWSIRNFQLDGNHVEVWSYPFSATMCGQRFEGLRDMKVAPGEEPPVSFLDRLEGEPPDDHELSHHSQINSNKLVASKSYAPRMAKMHYVPVPPSAPDHFFHCWRMMMAVLEIWGVDGIAGVTEPEAGKALAAN
jgi:hypothetical protein